MTRSLKLALIAAAAAVAIGSPAFAETYLNEMGTGDLHPIINQSGGRSYVAQTRYRDVTWSYASNRRRGLSAYAMVGPRGNGNDPRLTGGGSFGYNANLLTY